MVKRNKRISGHRVLLEGFLCLLILCALASQSATITASLPQDQVKPAAKPQQQPKSKVYLIHSDLLRKDSKHPDAQVVVGNVVFRHDSIYMYCDSAYYYDKISSFEAFSNVRMEQGDTLYLYGDHLFYDGNTQIAEMRMNVRMENQSTTLLTDSLNYDRVYSLGYYFEGGTMLDADNVLTSDWGEFNTVTKQSVFNYNVKLVNKQFTLTSDTLQYNSATKIANIVGPSDIVSGGTHIYSENGTYNTMTGLAWLYDRSVMTNGARKLTGDTLFFSRDSAYGEAFTNVIMTDTLNKNLMTGEYGYYNDSLKFAFSTINAVAVDYSQGDSLFLHGDTLLMETFNFGTDSLYREMRAFHKVRFYRTDVQGVSDSLVFSSTDSCLTMYYDPVLWNGEQQLLGEKILIFMNDSTVDWAHIINQALSVEEIDSALIRYNQVTGKEMKAYFRDGEMKKTEVIGSVRLVYYPMDSDSLIIGMNVSETSQLDVYLENRKVDKMIMFPASNGTLYPLPQSPPDKKKLSNFVWLDYIRPLDKNDIFEWREKRSGDVLKKNVRGPVELPNEHLFDNMPAQMQVQKPVDKPKPAPKPQAPADTLGILTTDSLGVALTDSLGLVYSVGDTLNLFKPEMFVPDSLRVDSVTYSLTSDTLVVSPSDSTITKITTN